MENERLALKELLERLKVINYIPGPLQTSKLGKTFYVNCELKHGLNIISEYITCGMDKNLYIATIKALVEAIERNAFKEGKASGLRSCSTERSDGFAAYPIINKISSKDALIRARDNALCEAVERFVWSTWWDSPLFGHVIVDAKDSIQSIREASSICKHLRSIIDIESIKIVYPNISPSLSFDFCIVLIKIKNEGYVTGGSCELRNTERSPLMRALYEAGRHLIAYWQAKKYKLEPISFYEKRLMFFASGDGNEIVKRRLNIQSRELINLSVLEIDEEVNHSMKSAVICYRVLFKNQPEFIGGKLERLCI